MTPFAQLGRGLEKSAGGAGRFGHILGRGLRRTFRKGVWSQLGRTAGRMQANGSTNPLLGGVRNVSKVMGGKTGRGISAYGLAGFVGDGMGINLPGSDLAFAAAAPGYAAAFAAPSVISSGRMLRSGNQQRVKDDVMAGAHGAANDFLTGVNVDPSTAYKPGQYGQFMESHGYDMSGADNYRTGSHRPMSRMEQLRAVFSDSQRLVDNQVDKNIYDHFSKSGNVKSRFGSYLGGLFKGRRMTGLSVSKPGKINGALGTAGSFAIPAAAAGSIGYSALSDKPYDEGSVYNKGYYGAQAEIQNRLAGMNSLERLAVRFDPSLVAHNMERAMPGTIGRWEQHTGETHKPGWMSQAMNSWNKGGTPSFYTYDAAGKRHYI